MLLNKEKADELFRKYAVLIGKVDVIPEFRAVNLFGEDAVDFARRIVKNCSNGFGVGDYTIFISTIRGFNSPQAITM